MLGLVGTVAFRHLCFQGQSRGSNRGINSARREDAGQDCGNAHPHPSFLCAVEMVHQHLNDDVVDLLLDAEHDHLEGVLGKVIRRPRLVEVKMHKDRLHDILGTQEGSMTH